MGENVTSEHPPSQSLVKGHLWESANLLRGTVDAADFQTYIFPMRFFKHVVDVWNEEFQEIVDDTGDARFIHRADKHARAWHRNHESGLVLNDHWAHYSVKSALLALG